MTLSGGERLFAVKRCGDRVHDGGDAHRLAARGHGLETDDPSFRLRHHLLGHDDHVARVKLALLPNLPLQTTGSASAQTQSTATQQTQQQSSQPAHFRMA